MERQLIGKIDNGCDGKSYYYLLDYTKEDTFNPLVDYCKVIETETYNTFRKPIDSISPGSLFFNSCNVYKQSGNVYIVVLHYLYDN